MHDCVRVLSFQVPLGILLKSEIHMDEMIDILKHVQRYVPTVTSQEQVVVSNDEVTVITDSFHKILLGGDQLTAARIRSSQRIVKNSERGLDRLEGLTAVIEDWHAKQCMMQVSSIVSTHPTAVNTSCPCRCFGSDYFLSLRAQRVVHYINSGMPLTGGMWSMTQRKT